MLEAPRKRWSLRPEEHPPEWIRLGHEWGIPPPILTVLWNRGLRTPAEVGRFLAPSVEDLADPFLLPDLELAVERVGRAIHQGESILVFGDYDVDGITAAALWTRMLRYFGAQVRPMVPNRMEDGYGLSLRAVEEAAASGIRLLIANDCGTTAHESIGRARNLGLDIIVADHHTPEAGLPPALALVNPRRKDSRFPFPDLAAVGVAFKILQGLCQRRGGAEDRRFLLNHLDLVTLGTVADVVPLRGENRILVHFGMRVLRVRRRPAFQALVEQAGLTEKWLEASHVAFSLAPRLNASGRLGFPGRTLDLLLADDLEEARSLAQQLEKDNWERRRLHERVLAEATELIELAPEAHGVGAIVLGSRDWHPGVLGIAASRLVERYRVPVILIALEGQTARGSARTPAGIDLLELVGRASEHLVAFGGHRQAVGMSLRPEQYESFRESLQTTSQQSLSQPPEATLDLDGMLEPRFCNLDLARWVERLGPFGEGNQEPLFEGRVLCRSPQVLKERHLRLQAVCTGGNLDCIGFGLGERASEIPAGGAVLRLAYSPSVNRFRGQERVQLKLREIDLV